MESINALPIKDVITFGPQGIILVNDRPLTKEQLILLKNGADALEKNWTYKLIKEQVTYQAIKMGLHQSISLDATFVAKAAIWVQQEERKLIDRLKLDV